MIKYVAFLRGINVGGKKLIKMENLTRAFESLGFENVRTFIQSGNVIFEAAEKDVSVLAKKIEKKLQTSLGHQVPVLLRSFAELKSILKRDPFKKIKPDANVMMFVTFLSAEPAGKVKLPLMLVIELRCEDL